MNIKTTHGIIIAIVIAGGVALGLFFYLFNSSDPQNDLETRYDRFRDIALRRGLLGEQALSESLRIAESPRERARLEIKFAFGQKNNSNTSGAIETLKRVAANESYENIDRAYAIESMGRMYYSEHDPKIFSVIFSGQPYQDFLADDRELSLRRLHEYASSFHPSAIAEFRIAEWYSDEILRVQRRAISDEEKKSIIESLVPIIKERFENAEADIVRQTTWPNPSYERISYAMTVEAVILGNLYLTDSAGMFPFPIEPEATFQQAIYTADQDGIKSQVEWASYHYAQFLSEAFGVERQDDIQNLLSRIYTPRASGATTPFFKNQAILSGESRESIAGLAELDAGFQRHLSSLGWDFE